MSFSFLNAIVSTIVVLGLLASALGWRHSLRGEYRSPEWYFAMAKVVMATGIGFRMLFWDVIWGTLNAIDPHYAVAWSNAFGRTNVNLFASAILLLGVYYSLKARQLILLQDRGINWHWTIAWAYPKAKVVVRIINRGR